MDEENGDRDVAYGLVVQSIESMKKNMTSWRMENDVAIETPESYGGSCGPVVVPYSTIKQNWMDGRSPEKGKR